MFRISEARKDDVPAIIRIAGETWWPTYSGILTAHQIQYMLDAIYAPQVLESQIQEGHQKYLLLREDGEVQGFVSYGPRPENRELYKIHKLYVLPHNQKKGYGRALIQHVIKELRRKKIRILDLNVNRYNPARGFYERLGFRVVSCEDIPIGPYWMNDYVMRLQL